MASLNLEAGAVAAEQARAAVRARQARLAENTAAIAENDTARAGDIIRVELQNEPDLPNTFVVQSDGTIRLPLVGTLKVVGLTPRQVQDAVRKQFTDRRLEAGASAVVSVHRSRTSRNEAR
jgi:protein involved in polysaccharide export with SLBB domain